MTTEELIDLGVQHQRAGRLAEAEEIFAGVLAQQPRNADALHLLGVLSGQRDNPRAAVEFIERAIAINPKVALFHFNLGISLNSIGRFAQATAAYRTAVELKPDFAPGHNNLSVALWNDGKIDQAMEHCRTALRLKPDYIEAHNRLGMLLLLRGDFENGWREFEWRRRPTTGLRLRHSPEPPWKGDDLAGRTILLHAEQGIGDTIQFVRYVPDVVARGGKILLQCQAELVRLLQDMPGLSQVLAIGQPTPNVDVQCPLLSLPLTLGLPNPADRARTPYLAAEAVLSQRWGSKIATTPGKLRVGLVWAGSATHENDRARSIQLQQLAALAKREDVHFHSLQKGPASSQAVGAPGGMKLADWTADLNDFADTAALVANLDLIISVDTAVAHLAGAMGKPVWVMLPVNVDWRWMLRREDTPWYPTMRLFRQESPGDWFGVVDRIGREMDRLCGSMEPMQPMQQNATHFKK